jgi:hypothetical protein
MNQKLITKLLTICALFLAFSSAHTWAQEFTAGNPADGTSASETYKPGLKVTYFFRMFDHVDELKSISGGIEGSPIEQLNHVSFEDGQVLTTDRPDGVGAHIRGLLKFSSAGSYTLKLQSNDGVKLDIGGVHLHSDPEIHAARWSPDMSYNVNTAGWYDLKIDYYQRKGTAALRMKWVTPNGTEEVIPTSAFAHR